MASDGNVQGRLHRSNPKYRTCVTECCGLLKLIIFTVMECQVNSTYERVMEMDGKGECEAAEIAPGSACIVLFYRNSVDSPSQNTNPLQRRHFADHRPSTDPRCLSADNGRQTIRAPEEKRNVACRDAQTVHDAS